MDIGGYPERQRVLLTQRISQLTPMVRAVDTLPERMRGDGGHKRENAMSTPLIPPEQAEILGTDWDPANADEAKERWGDLGDCAESSPAPGLNDRGRLGARSRRDRGS